MQNKLSRLLIVVLMGHKWAVESVFRRAGLVHVNVRAWKLFLISHFSALIAVVSDHGLDGWL